MKITPIFAIAVCLGLLVGYPAGAQGTNKITVSINFVSVPVDKVLDVYEGLAEAQLIVASDVQRSTHGITLRAMAVSREVERQMIEQALLKQAGIVITRLDDKRVSVTYNDKLELKP